MVGAADCEPLPDARGVVGSVGEATSGHREGPGRALQSRVDLRDKGPQPARVGGGSTILQEVSTGSGLVVTDMVKGAQPRGGGASGERGELALKASATPTPKPHPHPTTRSTQPDTAAPPPRSLRTQNITNKWKGREDGGG